MKSKVEQEGGERRRYREEVWFGWDKMGWVESTWVPMGWAKRYLP